MKEEVKKIFDDIRRDEEEWEKIWKEEISKGRKHPKRLELLVYKEDIEASKRELKSWLAWGNFSPEDRTEIEKIIKSESIWEKIRREYTLQDDLYSKIERLKKKSNT